MTALRPAGTRLWTTRTARVLLALAAAGTMALTVLVLTFAGRPGQPALGDDALRQLVLAPNGPLTLAALVLGILGMAGEFRHGTAATFLVTPVRGRVVAAKLVAAVASLAIALVAAAVVLAIALPWLPAERRPRRHRRPRPGSQGGRAGRRGDALRRARHPAPQPVRGRDRRAALVAGRDRGAGGGPAAAARAGAVAARRRRPGPDRAGRRHPADGPAASSSPPTASLWPPQSRPVARRDLA